MNEYNFYSRQMILKAVGAEGQNKLKKLKVLIVGAGGLGHPVATYLAAAGIGNISIADFDNVETSNLNRQVCFTPFDLGLNKAVVLSERIKKQNPFINVTAIQKKISTQNIEHLFHDFDMILDCSDNFKTKFLIHDCAYLLKKDLVQGSLFQYEGQIQAFNFSKKVSAGCLRCLWKDIPGKNGVQNCQEAGVVGAVAGTIGTFQAMEAIKLILGIGTELQNTTVIVDLLNLEIQKIKWKKNHSCELCGQHKTISQLMIDHKNSNEIFELEGLEHKDIVFIDIREKEEITKSEKSFVSWPLSERDQWQIKINSDQKYLFICQKGLRSSDLVKQFRQSNMTNCFSLCGGLENV